MYWDTPVAGQLDNLYGDQHLGIGRSRQPKERTQSHGDSCTAWEQ
jgi:hypothetical protein